MKLMLSARLVNPWQPVAVTSLAMMSAADREDAAKEMLFLMQAWSDSAEDRAKA